MASLSALILALTLAPLANTANPGAIKFPEKLAQEGYLAGIWDVGACTVSGQPTEEAFRKMAADGVKTVINLRGHGEMNDRSVVPFDEAALLKDLKINYVHIPMGEPDEYNRAAVTRFAEAMGKAEGKVALHCTVAWRASYMWASYLYAYKGYSFNDAIKNGEAMNFSANRVAALLGAEMTYEPSPKKVGARTPGVAVVKSKVSIKPPKAVFAPNEKDYMAFTLWEMGDVLNGSQPNAEQLKDLASKGVKTIINIRTSAEMAGVKREGFDEEAVARELGLRYVHIPMQSPESFSPANLKLVADAIAASDGKTLLHCQTATRTSSIWPAYLVKYQGMTLDEAMKHAEAMRYSNLLNVLLDIDIAYKIKMKAPAGGCGGGLRFFR